MKHLFLIHKRALFALSQSETRFAELGEYSRQDMLREAFWIPNTASRFVAVRRITRTRFAKQKFAQLKTNNVRQTFFRFAETPELGSRSKISPGQIYLVRTGFTYNFLVSLFSHLLGSQPPPERLWRQLDVSQVTPPMTTCKPNSKRRVYDILPPTTAVIGYVIGLRKLSSNGQFLVGAQTTVSLQQLKLYQVFVL